MSQLAFNPTTSSPQESSNWGILALLRFFLAMIVAIFHLSFYAQVGIFGWLVKLGPLEAVMGFLLVSGYSIGHSIQRKPRDFLRRRMWRIYPVFLAATILTYLLHPEPLTAVFLGVIVLNLLFLSQIFFKASYLDAGWSLSLEVWLYLFAPLLVRLRFKTLEWLILLSFLCFSIYTCGRSLFHWPYFVQTLYGINFPTLGFIWLAGFYLAMSAIDAERPLKLLSLVFMGYLGLALAIQILYRLKHHDIVSFFVYDVPHSAGNGILFLLLYFIFRGVARHQFHLGHLSRKACQFLGDISYPLYLVHFPVFIFLSQYEKNAALLMLAAFFVATSVYFGCDFYSRRREVK